MKPARPVLCLPPLLLALGCGAAPPTYEEFRLGKAFAGLDLTRPPTPAELADNEYVARVIREAGPVVFARRREPADDKSFVPRVVALFDGPAPARAVQAVAGWLPRPREGTPQRMVAHHPRRGTIFIGKQSWQYFIFTQARGIAELQVRDPAWLEGEGMLDEKAWRAAARAATTAEPFDRSVACGLVAAGPLSGKAAEVNYRLIERISEVDEVGEGLRESIGVERLAKHQFLAILSWLKLAPRDVCRYPDWTAADGRSPPTWSPRDLSLFAEHMSQAREFRASGPFEPFEKAFDAIPQAAWRAEEPSVPGPEIYDPLLSLVDSPEGAAGVEAAMAEVQAVRAKWAASAEGLARLKAAEEVARAERTRANIERMNRERDARRRAWREGGAVAMLARYIEGGRHDRQRLSDLREASAAELDRARAEGRHATVMAWLAVRRRLDWLWSGDTRKPLGPPPSSHKPYVPELRAVMTGAPPKGVVAEGRWRVLKVITLNPVVPTERLLKGTSSGLVALQPYNRAWTFGEFGLLVPWFGDVAEAVGPEALWPVDGGGEPMRVVDLKPTIEAGTGMARGRKTVTVKVGADIRTVEKLWARKAALQEQMSAAAGREVTVYDGALATSKVREGRHSSGARRALPSLGTETTQNVGAGRTRRVGRDEAALGSAARELAEVDAQIAAASGGTRQIEVDTMVEYPLEWQVWTGRVTGSLTLGGRGTRNVNRRFSYRYLRHGPVPAARLAARNDWVDASRVVERALAAAPVGSAWPSACRQVHDRLRAAVTAEGEKAGWSADDTARELALRRGLLCTDPDYAAFPDWTALPVPAAGKK